MSELGLVFPGQGSQRQGMALDFCDQFECSRAVFTEASEALGYDMQALCSSADERLNQTEYTQPAVLTAEIAIFQALEERQAIRPVVFAGHSLGEYTALVAAGVLSLADGVRIVRRRGELMQAAVPLGEGAMIALIGDNLAGLEYQPLVLQAGAEIANLNSPNQVVISGAAAKVERARDLITERLPEVQIVRLNVSAPFHSSLMRGIEAEFRELLLSLGSKINRAAAARVLSNFTGAEHSADRLVDNLVSQISGPVQWVKNMDWIRRHTGMIYELGPSRVLSKFFSAVGVASIAVTDLRTLKRAFPEALAG